MAEAKIKDQKLKIKNTDKNLKTTKKSTEQKVESAVKVEKARKTTAKSGTLPSTLKVDVYDLSGKVVDSMELPKTVFGNKVNKNLIAQAVRIYLANQRAGSASTKSRGEVQGSTRKIYRQKGTGRARHGGIRAPIFVHGGVAHGPKPRDFSLVLPQKMRRAALLSSLSAKAQNGSIKVVTGFEGIQPKTKVMVELLKEMDIIGGKKKILFVMDSKYDNIVRAVRNIEGLSYDFAKQLNTYEVIRNQVIILMKKAVSEIENTFIEKK